MYSKMKLNSWYFTTAGFYLFHIPVKVPYKEIYARADQAGLKRKEAFGPILEKGKLLGSGWIGIEVEKPATPRNDVIEIAGDFQTYEYRGPYKSIGKACSKIKKDHPNAMPTYFLYLDDPEKTRPEDCRTLILFK